MASGAKPNALTSGSKPKKKKTKRPPPKSLLITDDMPMEERVAVVPCPSGTSVRTVDEYLNEVDYEAMRNYKPLAFSIQFINFIKVISTGMDMDESPPVHYKMLDSLCDRRQYLAVLCSRGLAKTSLFSEILFLYLAVYQELPGFGLCNTAIYVADSMENGAKSLRKNMETRYEKSRQLKQLLPEAKFTDAYIEFTNVAGQKFGLKLYGAQSGIRGTKIFGNRPLLCVMDDLVNDEAAGSPTSLNKISDTIYKGVIPALDPKKRKIIFCGTPFNKADPLYKAIESGGWHVNVYPVCEKYPCTEEEFKGAWEARFDYASLGQQYMMYKASGEIKAFKQEMMLRIASDEDRMISDSDIRWFNTYELMAEKHKYNFYITSDFATSTQRRADFTVLGVWAVDHQQNRYLVDGVIGRQLMATTFDDLFRLVAKYGPMSVGIEVTGQQGGFISLLRSEMQNRKTYFTIAKSIGSTKEGIAVRANKMERFRLTVAQFNTGKVYLPTDLKDSMLLREIMEEIGLATIDGIKSQHDDAIDMISQLDQMHIVYPSLYQSSLSKQDSEARDHYFNDTSLDVTQISDYLV